MGLLIGVVVTAALNGLTGWNLRRLVLADERTHLRNATLLLVAALIMQRMATAMAGVSYLHDVAHHGGRTGRRRHSANGMLSPVDFERKNPSPMAALAA